MTTRQKYRIVFHEELERLEQTTLSTFDLVGEMIDRSIECILNHDAELAGMVVADDDRVDGRYLDVHQGLLNLIALQAPVASDLRLVAALLHVIVHIERMADQCVNAAKLVPLSGSQPPSDDRLLELIKLMGEQAGRQTQQAKQALALRDAALAEDLVQQDDVLDRLNRDCFALALSLGDTEDQREWAMHMILTARYWERLGDHTVDIGEQTAFVVTGEFREFSDSSPAPRAGT